MNLKSALQEVTNYMNEQCSHSNGSENYCPERSKRLQETCSKVLCFLAQNIEKIKSELSKKGSKNSTEITEVLNRLILAEKNNPDIFDNPSDADIIIEELVTAIHQATLATTIDSTKAKTTCIYFASKPATPSDCLFKAILDEGFCNTSQIMATQDIPEKTILKAKNRIDQTLRNESKSSEMHREDGKCPALPYMNQFIKLIIDIFKD